MAYTGRVQLRGVAEGGGVHGVSLLVQKIVRVLESSLAAEKRAASGSGPCRPWHDTLLRAGFVSYTVDLMATARDSRVPVSGRDLDLTTSRRARLISPC